MDVRFLASIFLLFFFGPSLLSCQPNSFGPSCNRPLFPSDGNLLILQWPITFCYKQGRCSLKEPLHKWIIHGLWPQFNASNSKLAKEVSGSPYPQYCCHPQNEIDLAELPSRLGEQMSKVWPSLKQSRRSAQSETFSFWRHEWNKHGTCAVQQNSVKEQIFTAEAYFATVLQLYSQFPLSRWLASARIVPSNELPYSRARIHQALENENEFLRGVFRLKCDQPPQQQSPAVLSEVQICLDRSLKPVHCAHLFGGRRRTGRKYESFQVFETFDEKCGNEVMLLES